MIRRLGILLLIGTLSLIIGKVSWNWMQSKPPDDTEILEYLKMHNYPPVGIPEFAAMASAAYDDDAQLTGNAPILKKWHRIPDMRMDESSGLAYTVFINYVYELDHWLIVFVFRGTEFDDLRDWRSNFRNLRLKYKRGEEDQYIAAATRVLEDVDWVYDEYGPQASYYAVGHSPVTGWDIALEETEASIDWQPFRIVSIYERGEVLEYVRDVYSAVNDYPDGVDYEEFVFDYTAGNPILQHSMKVLAKGLLKDSIRLGLKSEK